MNEHIKDARRTLRDVLETALERAINEREYNNRKIQEHQLQLDSYSEVASLFDARIAEVKAALTALDEREAADAPPAQRYVAVINTPGYLPDSDEPPPTFDSAREAWDFLAEQRQRAEDAAMDAEVMDKALDSDNPRPYSNTWRLLAQLGDAAAWLITRTGSDETFLSAALDLDSLSIHPNVNELGLGSVWGNTPGYDESGGTHDLGVAYSVMIAEPETADRSYSLCCNKGPHDHHEDAHYLLAAADLGHHLPARHGIEVADVLSEVNTEAAVRYIVDGGIDDSSFTDEVRRLMVWHEQFHGRDGS